MKISCDIVIGFDDVKKLKTVLRSIKVDDFHFVRSRSDGKHLVAHIESRSVSSLLHTLDDYLGCVSVAEKTEKIVDKN